MAEILSLNASKYVKASELENLEDYEGRTFIIRKNDTVKAYRLKEVKRNSVYLEYIGDREDKFSLPLNKFLRYYELPNKA